MSPVVVVSGATREVVFTPDQLRAILERAGIRGVDTRIEPLAQEIHLSEYAPRPTNRAQRRAAAAARRLT